MTESPRPHRAADATLKMYSTAGHDSTTRSLDSKLKAHGPCAIRRSIKSSTPSHCAPQSSIALRLSIYLSTWNILSTTTAEFSPFSHFPPMPHHFMGPGLPLPPPGPHAPGNARFEFVALLSVPPIRMGRAHARALPATSATPSSDSESDDEAGFEFLSALPGDHDHEHERAAASPPPPCEFEPAHVPVDNNARFILIGALDTPARNPYWHRFGRGRGRGAHRHHHGPRHAHPDAAHPFADMHMRGGDGRPHPHHRGPGARRDESEGFYPFSAGFFPEGGGAGGGTRFKGMGAFRAPWGGRRGHGGRGGRGGHGGPRGGAHHGHGW